MHAQVLLYELCEPKLLQLHILIVIGPYDIPHPPRVCQAMKIPPGFYLLMYTLGLLKF